MIIGLSGYIGSGKDTVGSMIQYLSSGSKKSFKEYFSETIDGIHFNVSDANLYTQKWQIKKFAGKLKEIASMLTGIPTEKFEDQEFKKTYLGEEWGVQAAVNMAHKDKIDFDKYKVTTDLAMGFKNAIRLMSVREFLQKLGTESVREGLHQNAWVNALFADYKPNSTWDKFVNEKGEEVYKFPEPIHTDYPNWIITDTRFPNEAEAIKARGGIVARIERRASIDDEMIWGTNPPRHASETGLDDWKFDYVINNNGSLEELQEAVKTFLNNIEN